MLEATQLKIESRGYQTDLIEKVKQYYDDGITRVCLAAAPGAGKTYMSSVLIKDWVSEGLSVLILAHGTTVLKNQFKDRLKEYGFSKKELSLVKVTLPQSEHTRDNKYDIIVIDEAHEFYPAEKKLKKTDDPEMSMVSKILKTSKPRFQLLLTGTPSKLIAKGIKTVGIPLSKMPLGIIAPLSFQLVNVDYDFTDRDLNKSGDLKEKYNLNSDVTKESIHQLAAALLKHTRNKKPTKFNTLNKIVDLTRKVFTKLPKALIACANIQQATDLTKAFKELGVPCLISHSKNDTDSEVIRDFQNNKSHRLLIVVQRGILGFDCSDLEIVIDMTGTKNINRIYQLFGRVLRKKADVNKTYLKMSPPDMRDIYECVMNGALALTTDQILEWDGDHRKLKILVEIPPKKSSSNKSAGRTEKRKNEKYKLPDFGGTLDVISVFDRCHKSVSGVTTVYAEVSYKEVLCKYLGKRFEDSGGKKQKILDICKSHKGYNKEAYKEIKENKLYNALVCYCGSTQGAYDKIFHNKMMEFGYGSQSDIKKQKMQEILDICKSHKGYNKETTKTLKENKLYSVLSKYYSPASEAYDKTFHNKMIKFGYGSQSDIKKQKMQKILDICKSHKGYNKEALKEIKENKLYKVLMNYCSPTSGTYDKTFHDKVMELGYGSLIGKK